MKSATATWSSLLVMRARHKIIGHPCPTVAFLPSPSLYYPIIFNRIRPSDRSVTFVTIHNGNGEGDSSINDFSIDQSVPNYEGLDIIRGRENEISDETWRYIEGSAPSQWMVMKNLLGINIFTYILAAAIVFFLSMNAALGPGWLGQSLGWEDVGTFTKVSDSLPLNVDVSAPEYLL